MCGIKVIEVHTDAEGKAETLTVDMGEPILAPKDIPVVADSEPVVDLTLSSCGKDFDFTCVSMGNPHAVTFIDTPVKEFEVESMVHLLKLTLTSQERLTLNLLKL